MLLFIGGPLTAGSRSVRRDTASRCRPSPTSTCTTGPKVVHRYDLEPLIDGVGIYNLRPPAQARPRHGGLTAHQP